MFTGIIEETGKIQAMRSGNDRARLTIAAQVVPPTLKLGDSVAVNGVCLTTIQSSRESFSCDLSAETLEKTSFAEARIGTVVNLERPLAAGARLGGHFVLGHVDGVGESLAVTPTGDGAIMEFGYPHALERFLVYKGSIAVDGISFTIASLRKSSFTVAVIPHTIRVTNLRHFRVGKAVNLEVDVLGRYFERFFQLGLGQAETSVVTEEYLKNHGF